MGYFKKIQNQFLTTLITVLSICGQSHAQELNSWQRCIKKNIERQIATSNYKNLGIKVIYISNKNVGEVVDQTAYYNFIAIDVYNREYAGFIKESVANKDEYYTCFMVPSSTDKNSLSFQLRFEDQILYTIPTLSVDKPDNSDESDVAEILTQGGWRL